MLSFFDMRKWVLGSGTLAVLAMAGGLSVTPLPAKADTNAINRNVILGVAAAAAAVLIYNNVQAKNRNQATVVLGHTSDGGTIYADGHVGYPNGDVLYTGNGGTPCNWLPGGTFCNGTPQIYYPQGYHGHDHGHHYGWYKNCHNPHNPCHHDNDNDQGDEDDHGHGHGHGDHDGH